MNCINSSEQYTQILKPYTIIVLQERDVKFFTETEENQAMMAPRAGVPYFL
jgi:hypothetical protein